MLNLNISTAFLDFIRDNNAREYIHCGGYGSGKSYACATKLVLECLKEKRKALVVRRNYTTLRESCYNLILRICEEMGMEVIDVTQRKQGGRNAVLKTVSPLTITFPNGSVVIFRGGDEPKKLKSIFDVSLIWIEELAEFENNGIFAELKLRLRSKAKREMLMVSFNPTSKKHWIYKEFFLDDEILKEMEKKQDKEENIELSSAIEKYKQNVPIEEFYEDEIVIKGEQFLQHTTVLDNDFIEVRFIKSLVEECLKDKYLKQVAFDGKFITMRGNVFKKNFIEIPDTQTREMLLTKIAEYGRGCLRFGMDFGFETSYNALVEFAYLEKENAIVILRESYENKMLDEEFIKLPTTNRILMDLAEANSRGIDAKISADNAEPKTIKYYKSKGIKMRPCVKGKGSRIENMKKIKRLAKIYIFPECTNTYEELAGLKYKDNAENQAQFSTDPHTLSAIWYGADKDQF